MEYLVKEGATISDEIKKWCNETEDQQTKEIMSGMILQRVISNIKIKNVLAFTKQIHY